MKKLLAQILVFMFLFSTALAIPTSYAEPQYLDYQYHDDFETDTAGAAPAGWTDVSGAGSALVTEEGGNQFMRITKAAGAAGPSVRMTIDEAKAPSLFGNGKQVVMEAKIRTNNPNSGNKFFKINDYLGDSKEVVWPADYALWKIQSGSLLYTNNHYGQFKHSAYQLAVNGDGGAMPADTWKTVKLMVNPDSTGIYVWVDGESKGSGYYVWRDFHGMDALRTLSFVFDSDTAAGDTLDVDDVKVYYENPAPKVTNLSGGFKLSADAQELVIQFDRDMDASTLALGESIVVQLPSGYNASKDSWWVSGGYYDAATRTYHIGLGQGMISHMKGGGLINVEFGMNTGYSTTSDIYAANLKENYESGKMTAVKYWSVGMKAEGGGSDASLKEIIFDGHSVYDFAPDKYEYAVELPLRYAVNSDTPAMPEVTAITGDPAATVAVTSSNWDAYRTKIQITVTAADGYSKKTYSLAVRFLGENLFNDGGGFESQTAGIAPAYPWTDGGQGAVISSEQACGGAKSIYVPKKSTNNAPFYQTLTLLNNKTYLMSAAAKLASPESATLHFNFDANAPYAAQETFTANSSEWTRGFRTYNFNNTEGKTSVYAGLTTYVGDNTTTQEEYYADELYVGELLIGGVTLTPARSEVTVPETGTETVAIASEVQNQFGTIHGLYDEQDMEEWIIHGNPKGISVENGTVVVTSQAMAGTYVIEGIKRPSYRGAVQAQTGARCEITVKPNNRVVLGFMKGADAATAVTPGEITPTVYIGNATDAPKALRVYSGLYQKVGEEYRLVETVTKEFAAAAQSTVSEVVGTLSVPADGQYQIRSFAWSTDGGLQPLIPAAILP